MKRLIFILILLTGALALSAQYPPRHSTRIRHSDGRTIYIDPAQSYGPPGKMLPVRHGTFTRLYMNGWMLPDDYATMLMAENPEAYAAMRRANRNLIWACVAGTAGTIGIGWTLIDWANRPSHGFEGEFWDKHRGRESVNWIPAAAGAVLWFAVIPLVGGYNRNIQYAASHYNHGLELSGHFAPRKPCLAPADSGIGLALKF